MTEFFDTTLLSLPVTAEIDNRGALVSLKIKGTEMPVDLGDDMLDRFMEDNADTIAEILAPKPTRAELRSSQREDEIKRDE